MYKRQDIHDGPIFKHLFRGDCLLVSGFINAKTFDYDEGKALLSCGLTKTDISPRRNILSTASFVNEFGER